MKKGEIYEGIIEKIEFPNKGRIQVGGETVIVKMEFQGRRYGL